MKKLLVTRMEYPYPIFSEVGDNGAVDINTTEISKELFKLYKNSGEDITLICTGTSGVVIAMLLAKKLTKLFADAKTRQTITVCHIRKEGEKAHHTHTFVYGDDICIVVDDFVSSGATLQRIKKNLADRAGTEQNAHERVECICARNCDWDFAKDLFPNLKHILA